MTFYITSDLHFCHKNIMKYNPDTRPWDSVEEMNEGLIKEWNNVVKDGDIVYHLGDFCFGNQDQISNLFYKLNGVIVFIEGNHDAKLKKALGAMPYMEHKHNGIDIIMCHYPLAVWNRSHHGSIMLHGHTHGSYQGEGRILDVGWDAHGRLLLLDEAVEMCLNKPIHYPSHHSPKTGG